MARIDFPGKKVGFRQVKSVWVDGWQCGGGVFCTKIHTELLPQEELQIAGPDGRS